MVATLDILHIEDNEGDVGLVERALENWRVSCKLKVAYNGFQAMELLRDPANKKPDIIFLDINMPGMDGKKFLAARKEDPALVVIPTIMLTSSEAPSDIRECYELHANSYVVKPFETRDFIAVVREIVAFWSGSARLPTQSWRLYE